uniref:Uncharacterized protein n=1 Tax=Leersia perrieri TaxID=77586 RepID=A0A0D9XYI5_9ORYZ
MSSTLSVSQLVIGSAPDSFQLDELAALYHGQAERDTRDYVRSWICPSCKKEYKPIENILVDLPPYECKDCGLKNDAVYDWKISKTIFNKVSLDFKIYDQANKRHCTLYAVAAVVDVSRRVEAAKRGILAATPLDVIEMVTVYSDLTGLIFGLEPPEKLYKEYDNAPFVLETFKSPGIPLMIGPYDEMVKKDSADPIPRLRIKSYFSVDASNVPMVTRLLASGYPLVASIRTGCLFEYLKGDQYYYSKREAVLPRRTAENELHSVAVIGCGLASKNNKPEIFYSVRDSKGIEAHSHYQKRNFGGDFYAWSSDVIDLWGLYLA